MTRYTWDRSKAADCINYCPNRLNPVTTLYLSPLSACYCRWRADGGRAEKETTKTATFFVIIVVVVVIVSALLCAVCTVSTARIFMRRLARAESSVVESGFLLFELCNSSRVRGTKFGSREGSFFSFSFFLFFSTCSAEDAEEKVRTQSFGFWFWTCSKRNGCVDMWRIVRLENKKIGATYVVEALRTDRSQEVRKRLWDPKGTIGTFGEELALFVMRRIILAYENVMIFWR